MYLSVGLVMQSVADAVSSIFSISYKSPEIGSCVGADANCVQEGSLYKNKDQQQRVLNVNLFTNGFKSPSLCS